MVSGSLVSFPEASSSLPLALQDVISVESLMKFLDAVLAYGDSVESVFVATNDSDIAVSCSELQNVGEQISFRRVFSFDSDDFVELLCSF